MIFFLENEYTRKLNNSMNTSACLISTSDLSDLKPDAILVIDEVDILKLINLKSNVKKIIVLGETPTELSQTYTYISKYQSYKNIYKLIFDSNFPIFIATSYKSIEFAPDLIKSIKGRFESDYIISLNYNHSGAFSLYDCLNVEQYPFAKGEIYEIMTNLLDYMKPPIDDLVNLIKHIQKKGTVLIISTPLKGVLDLALIKLATTLIWVDDSSNSILDEDLKKINPQLQIHNLSMKQ